MVVLKAETVLKAGTVFKCLHLKMSFIITVPAFKPSFRDHTSSLIECLICYSLPYWVLKGLACSFFCIFSKLSARSKTTLETGGGGSDGKESS